MNFDQRIGFKFLFASRKNAFLSLIAVLAILSIGFGVAFLLLVLAVMEGFEADFRDKILGFDAHIVIEGKNGISDVDANIKKVENIEGVKAVSPFVEGEVLLSSSGKHQAAMVRGIDLTRAPKVLEIEKSLRDSCEGMRLLECFSQAQRPGVIVGSELAHSLHLFSAGKQMVSFLSPFGILGPFGFEPRKSDYVFIDSFQTGYYDYDTRVLMMDIAEAQKFFGNMQSVTGLEIRVFDVDQTHFIKQHIASIFPPEAYRIRDWKDRNAKLFSALQLEKVVMFIVLGLILVVASFLIFSTLSMLVSEKFFQIAILRTLGFSRKRIQALFLFQGLVLGFMGVAMGLVLGLLLIEAIDRYQFVQLPAQYYSTTVPVVIKGWNIVGTLAMALGVLVLGCWYPAKAAMRIHPVEMLRHE